MSPWWVFIINVTTYRAGYLSQYSDLAIVWTIGESGLRHYATSRNVADSIPDVIGFSV
jgi:hypothetical protein